MYKRFAAFVLMAIVISATLLGCSFEYDSQTTFKKGPFDVNLSEKDDGTVISRTITMNFIAKTVMW